MFFNNTASGMADDEAGYGTSNFMVATAEPLMALGDFGGPTQTMRPVRGGAAICASVALLPDGVTRDQRGFPRTSSATCVDAGSVQLPPVEVVPVLPMPLVGLLAGLFALLGMRRLQQRGA